MLSYLDTQNTLHTRLVDFNIQQYLFTLQVVLGERIEVAYASVFDTAEFKRNIPSEDEEEYLARHKQNAQIMIETQECTQLRSELEEQYRVDVQAAATDIKEWKFSGEDVQRLLSNLLHNRTQDLSESSVRDILALLKMMYESGSLDSGDSFQKHFITIPKKFDCICPHCNREVYLVEGLDNKCQHCSQVFTWDGNRFYPKADKL